MKKKEMQETQGKWVYQGYIMNIIFRTKLCKLMERVMQCIGIFEDQII